MRAVCVPAAAANRRTTKPNQRQHRHTTSWYNKCKQHFIILAKPKHIHIHILRLFENKHNEICKTQSQPRAQSQCERTAAEHTNLMPFRRPCLTILILIKSKMVDACTLMTLWKLSRSENFMVVYEFVPKIIMDFYLAFFEPFFHEYHNYDDANTHTYGWVWCGGKSVTGFDEYWFFSRYHNWNGYD